MVCCWLATLVGELVHQILQVTMPLVRPENLFAQARASAEAKGQAATDAQIHTSVYLSIAGMAGLALAILVTLSVMLWMLSNRTASKTAHQMLYIFSIYYGIRAVAILFTGVSSPQLPVWLPLLDGSIQEIVGVAAVLGLVFSSQPDSLKWAGVDTFTK